MARHLIHCSYHKCLTVYFSIVMEQMYNRYLWWSRGYRHFNSLVDEFYEAFPKLRVSSVNNHSLDLSRLGDFRVSRFVRDPRDMIVSGYFYHKRAAEAWCSIINPTDADWKVVNGTIPVGLASGDSYASFLNRVSEEEGLIAEIEFRTKHYDSMRDWPDQHPQILLLKYEDILGREQEAFRKILDFYELPFLEYRLGLYLAKSYSLAEAPGAKKHVRNPEPNQWKKHFTPKVSEYFHTRYADIVEKLGYEPVEKHRNG